jgi:WS/DGAT/MGAT family acyltransferase
MEDERLSALDTAFLCLESPQAPLHLGALAVFRPERPIPPTRLRSLLTDRIQRLPSLRQRVQAAWMPPGSAVWAEDDLFDPDRHLFLHELDTGTRRTGSSRRRLEADQSALASLAGQLMAEQLDLRHPLWQLHLVTGLVAGRFAILVKLHHALADGLRAVEFGVGLLDGFADQRPESPEPRTGGTDRFRPSLMGAARTAAALATRPDRALAGLARGVASLPGTVRQTADALGIASAVLGSARLGALPIPMRSRSPINTSLPSPMAALPGPATATPARADRRLALLHLDANDVRQVRKRHGGTDNDVLLAVISGALREWLVKQGHRAERVNLRALIPVSRRSRGDHANRGNVLSGYLCDLPVGEEDPLTRLREIRTSMDRNKAAGFTRGPGAFAVLANQLPAAVHRMASPLVRHGAGLLFDTMVTNVPLPSRPMSLAGARLEEVYPIAPLAPGQPLGIALSAYQGRVHVGLHADRQALPDLHHLADAVPAALAGLAAGLTEPASTDSAA